MANRSRRIRQLALILGIGSLFAGMRGAGGSPTEADDKKIVSELDRQYQEAVKRNDAATMGKILADDFVLITGKGRTQTKADLLKEAEGGTFVYEHQEDSSQTVRVWGDTAVVTALLWAKGTQGGKTFEYKLWFSDVYVRTPSGWRYVLGQAAQPLAQ
jgi:ketosteroid isomerase-like protein